MKNILKYGMASASAAGLLASCAPPVQVEVRKTEYIINTKEEREIYNVEKLLKEISAYKEKCTSVDEVGLLPHKIEVYEIKSNKIYKIAEKSTIPKEVIARLSHLAEVNYRIHTLSAEEIYNCIRKDIQNLIDKNLSVTQSYVISYNLGKDDMVVIVQKDTKPSSVHYVVDVNKDTMQFTEKYSIINDKKGQISANIKTNTPTADLLSVASFAGAYTLVSSNPAGGAILGLSGIVLKGLKTQNLMQNYEEKNITDAKVREKLVLINYVSKEVKPSTALGTLYTMAKIESTGSITPQNPEKVIVVKDKDKNKTYILYSENNTSWNVDIVENEDKKEIVFYNQSTLKGLNWREEAIIGAFLGGVLGMGWNDLSDEHKQQTQPTREGGRIGDEGGTDVSNPLF